MDKIKHPGFYIGTSNIVLPVSNKQEFPEAFKSGSRLTYYASMFNSVEVNSSFYKIPMAKTIVKWTTEVPESFRFSFKMHRDITHDKLLTCDPSLVEHFMHTINHAGSKKGSLLIQFPAGIRYNPAHLKCLLSLVQKHNEGWSVCVEFRHNSWYCNDIFLLLESYHSALVIHDMPKAATPEPELWTDFVYLRFHGPTGDYRGGYELDVLERNKDRIATWQAEGKTVYAYFNNTLGQAVFDALTLQELVTGRITYNR